MAGTFRSAFESGFDGKSLLRRARILIASMFSETNKYQTRKRKKEYCRLSSSVRHKLLNDSEPRPTAILSHINQTNKVFCLILLPSFSWIVYPPSPTSFRFQLLFVTKNFKVAASFSFKDMCSAITWFHFR